MKTLKVGIVLIFVLCGFICSGQTGKGAAASGETKDAKKTPAASKAATEKNVKPGKDSEKKADVKIAAYYFHGTARCVTCRKLEAYSEEAIKNGFANELKKGKLEWLVVNVEEKGNEHFIKDYQLYTKSLVLVETKGGRQAKWKNLDKIWEYVKNKDVFTKYVQDEVTLFMKDVPEEKKKDSAKEAK